MIFNSFTVANDYNFGARWPNGAPRAKRTSEAPLVCKCIHTRKFGNHVTVHRPSVRTTGQPMFTFTRSNYFGNPGENWLHIIVVINWQLSKQGIRWPVSLIVSRAQVSTHRDRVIFWSYPLASYWFSNDRRFKFIFLKFIWNMLCLCHDGPALLRFWFQTNHGRENSARYFKIQAGKTFSYPDHALVTLFAQFLCSDWSKFEFMWKIYAASWKLFTLTAEADRVWVNLWCF